MLFPTVPSLQSMKVSEYAYKLADPILFYKNICGNVENEYTRDQIDSQLKSELLTALQPAFAKISDMGVRYSALPGHADDLADALNEVLAQKWGARYGIEISAIGVNSVKAPEEDEKMIKELRQQQAQRMPKQQAGQPPKMQAGSWTCSCGTTGNTGKFCMECGSKKPENDGFWTCFCGTMNKGKFCTECGSRKPAGIPQYRCDKCDWEPEDPTKPPKFCPECGDPFGDEDIKK